VSKILFITYGSNPLYVFVYKVIYILKGLSNITYDTMINDIDWKICIHGYTFERYFNNIKISYKNNG